MKKIISIIIALVALVAAPAESSAQSQFKKGDLAFNVDYVLGTSGWRATNGFSLLGEYGFMSVLKGKGTISAGLLLGAGFHSEEADVHHNGWDWDPSFTRIRIGTRGTLHYSFIPQLDTYAGINFLFVDIESVDWEGDGIEKETEANFIAPALVAGCRFMFNDHVGVNAEFSWDDFQRVGIGLTFKP